MTPELKPVEGKVVIKFLEGENDDDDGGTCGTCGCCPCCCDRPQTCFAVVLAAGAKTSVKKGQTVLVSGWARNDPEVDDDTVITDNWSILAVVTAA